MRVADAACDPESFMDSEPFEIRSELIYGLFITADAFG